MTSIRPPQVADVDPDSPSELDRTDQSSDSESAMAARGRITGAQTAVEPVAMDSKAGPVIRLEQLRAFYGQAEQVKGIDLEFRANEVTAIIGPSGCGKSTMIRCINRMHEEIPGARAEGRVLLDDVDVYDPVDRRRRGAPGDRHGLPEAEPVPDDVGLRQRRRGPAPDLPPGGDLARARSSRRCAAQGCGTRSPTACPSPARASPAVSSSGCASPARSRSTPR